MKDILGNKLKVGDEIVAIIQPDTKASLIRGTISAFTKRKVVYEFVNWESMECGFSARAKPKSVVKVL